jgi:hypothetical protein
VRVAGDPGQDRVLALPRTDRRRPQAAVALAARTAQNRCIASAATVHLLRWLRRQLAQPLPLREHLEAAVANDDPAEARRLLAGADFSEAQRRHVDRLLSDWEHEHRART